MQHFTLQVKSFQYVKLLSKNLQKACMANISTNAVDAEADVAEDAMVMEKMVVVVTTEDVDADATNIR